MAAAPPEEPSSFESVYTKWLVPAAKPACTPMRATTAPRLAMSPRHSRGRTPPQPRRACGVAILSADHKKNASTLCKRGRRLRDDLRELHNQCVAHCSGQVGAVAWDYRCAAGASTAGEPSPRNSTELCFTAVSPHARRPGLSATMLLAREVGLAQPDVFGTDDGQRVHVSVTYDEERASSLGDKLPAHLYDDAEELDDQLQAHHEQTQQLFLLLAAEYLDLQLAPARVIGGTHGASATAASGGTRARACRSGAGGLAGATACGAQCLKF